MQAALRILFTTPSSHGLAGAVSDALAVSAHSLHAWVTQGACSALASSSAADVVKACGALLVPALCCCVLAIGGADAPARWL